MKLLNNELKIILSQLPSEIVVDTFGERECLESYEYQVADYWVCFKVRVITDSTKHMDYHGSYGEIPEVYTEVNSRQIDFSEVVIYDEDSNFMVPMDKQEEIFESIVRPKLYIK